MTLRDYFDQVRRLVNDNSLAFEEGFEMLTRQGSRETAGRIRGRLAFSGRTFLAISEQLEIVDGHVVKKTYAYYCVLDGVELWAHDKDPTHGVHRHDRFHARFDDAERSLKEVIERAWEIASNEDYWALPESDDDRS